MTEFRAQYFDGNTSRKHEVTVRVAAGVARIAGECVSREIAVAAARVSPRVGQAPQRVELPGGGLLLSVEFDQIEAAFGSPRREALAHRLETSLPFVAAALVVLVVIFWAGYRWGVPWAAHEASKMVPRAAEAQLAEQVLRSADGLLLEPTTLDRARQTAIRTLFTELRTAAGLPDSTRLEFRRAKDFIGANAFALPGGVVVLTDQLVNGLAKDSQVGAVIAHELGHLAERHSLRIALQNSILGLVSMAMLGDVSAVAGIAVTLPATLAHSGYSRDFERAADRYAFELLHRTGRSPADFAEALAGLRELGQAAQRERARQSEQMVRRDGEGHDPNLSTNTPTSPARTDPVEPDVAGQAREGDLVGYLSTHPEIDERIAAARAAIGQTVPNREKP
jgi:Zn-dependent protease with chaperone function